MRKVPRAVITHGHADHARAGHEAVLATPETLAIMGVRLGRNFAERTQALRYGEPIAVNGTSLSLHPAGHILGSAQVAIRYQDIKAVVTGDYKRGPDPTCPGFEPVPCDVFVSEATFGLPIFRRPPPEGEIAKILHSLSVFPDRAHVIGAYSLGKTQSVIGYLRAAGYEAPIFVARPAWALCALYQSFGIDLGRIEPAERLSPGDAAGAVIIAPPQSDAFDGDATHPPIRAFASGWSGIRGRRASPVDLSVILSDHADWPELLGTFAELRPAEIRIMHGDAVALIHASAGLGLSAQALTDDLTAAL